MPTKIWKYQDDLLTVEVRNAWTWSGKANEALWVNGELVCEHASSVLRSRDLMDFVTAHLEGTVKVGGQPYQVSAKLGSKWHGMSMGCHIFVNGKRVGGDLGARLHFVK